MFGRRYKRCISLLITSQVPRQRNDFDCGIYLLHFVETFMKCPEEFSETIIVSC